MSLFWLIFENSRTKYVYFRKKNHNMSHDECFFFIVKLKAKGDYNYSGKDWMFQTGTIGKIVLSNWRVS